MIGMYIYGELLIIMKNKTICNSKSSVMMNENMAYLKNDSLLK
jgi:hypothetical protein